MKKKLSGEKYNFRDDCLLLFLDHMGEAIETPFGKRLCFTEYVSPEWFQHYLKPVKDKTASTQ